MMKIIIGSILLFLSTSFSTLNAQVAYDYLPCENCSNCDTLVTNKKLQKLIFINCYYPNGKIRSEFHIDEKMKKTEGVGEKWAWYPITRVKAIYYNESGEIEKTEWWKNGELKKVK